MTVETKTRAITLKEGKIYQLDHVYDWTGLMPLEAYEHGDTVTGEFVEDDGGDEVRMLTTVKIKATISIG